MIGILFHIFAIGYMIFFASGFLFEVGKTPELNLVIGLLFLILGNMERDKC